MENAYPSRPIPRIHLQPESIDFIDNRLPRHNDVFAHQDLEWSLTSQEYVPIETTPSGIVRHPGSPGSNSGNEDGTFWAIIFSDAMSSFKAAHPDEPKDREASGCSIRTQSTWAGIHKQLGRSREVYEGPKDKVRGRLKRMFRQVGDSSIDSLQHGIDAIPDIDYVSPVLSVVRVLLDAFQAASDVRNKVESSFNEDSLEEQINDIEVFLTLYPDRQRIRDASIDLVVSIMKAVEDVIGFFLSSQASRAVSAVGRGKDGYQKQLLQSIDEIQACSGKLVHQAQNLHFSDTKKGLSLIWDQTGRLVVQLRQTDTMIAYLVRKVESVEQTLKRQLLNKFNKLLDKHERLIETLEASRPSTPTPIPQERPQQLVWAPSVQLLVMPPMQQQQQQQLQQLPESYYSHSGPGPAPAAPWQTPYHFNNSLNNSPPQPSTSAMADGASTIQSLLNIPPNLSEHDLRAVEEAAYRIPSRDYNIVARVSRAPQFLRWMASPESRGLFAYHSAQHQPGSSTASLPRVSALSFFCATLARAVETRGRDKFAVAAFFCGLHIEEDDDDDNDTPIGVGGAAMARSLASQLLRSVNAGRPVPAEETRWDRRRGVPSGVDPDGVAKMDVVELCRLLVWLVRTQLSADQTLVCVVDGVGHYDTDELETDTLMVLRTLRWLARGTRGGGHAVVKVLVTSTTAAHDVRGLFVDDDDDEGCFLSVAELPQSNLGSSPRAPRSTRERNILEGHRSAEDDSENSGPDSEGDSEGN